MTAETIAKALGGRKAGGGWTARCPAHDDRTPSLSIRDADDGKVLVRCHAGCDQERVIAALRSRGLWAENSPSRCSSAWRAAALSSASRITTTPGAARRHSRSGNPLKRHRERWSRPISPRAAYRPAAADALRFHAGLKHPSGGIWPAMVALVTSGADGTPLAIHRTFLARDGGGKAPVESAEDDARSMPRRCRAPRRALAMC